MTPDFTKIDLAAPLKGPAYDAKAWERMFKSETGKAPDEMNYKTMEQIDVAPLYTEANNANYPHTRLCTSRGLGQSDSTPASRQLKRATRFTAATWPPVKKVYRLRLT